jgi:DeoR/GlpR family transcriptional regulator of sugar metabolism
MIPEERRKQILDILEKRKYVSVEEFANLLYVSLPTVRRDLKELEREGVLSRTHGGASWNMSDRFLAPFAMREKMNRREKQQIVGIAA